MMLAAYFLLENVGFSVNFHPKIAVPNRVNYSACCYVRSFCQPVATIFALHGGATKTIAKQ